MTATQRGEGERQVAVGGNSIQEEGTAGQRPGMCWNSRVSVAGTE